MSDLLHEHEIAGERHRDLPLFFVLIIMIIVALGVAVGTSFVWAKQYEGRIAPNVWIGSIPVGGLDTEAARGRAQKQTDTFLTHGFTIVLEGDRAILPLATSSGGDVVEDAVLDLEAAVAEAERLATGKNDLDRTLLFLRLLKDPVRIPLPVTLNRERVASTVRGLFPDREQAPEDAAFQFTKSPAGWAVQILPDRPGQTFQFDPFFEALTARLAALDPSPIPLTIDVHIPSVSLQDASKTTGMALAALERAPYIFTYTSERLKQTGSWKLQASALADMLIPIPSLDGPRIGVQTEMFDTFLSPISAAIDVEARDAKFRIQDGRVVEFSGSKEGVKIRRDATEEALVIALNDGGTDIVLSTEVATPEHTTAEVNNLGITEVLGVGVSSYRGSPRNRIKNIRNGVQHLNGILIAPDETFSLLNALAPFTTENGYLPELVIKGDKIEPEIGGGLCQLGTTTFRATMMSGLPVKERRNHSIVVSYYNDPANGNPGTDATIYEPYPDFKFTNDTGQYILFEAEMLEAKQELHFTFWGTSDGREGSYTPPVVLRWIPAGESKNIETLDLPPGKIECQAVHIGADTTFTYQVEHPDGSLDEETFVSHYRPIPKTCLVGVEILSTPLTENETTPADTSAPPVPFE